MIYNHRLYSHYGTRSFVDFMRELRRRVAFDLVICDPMPNRSANRDRMDDSVTSLRRYIRAKLQYSRTRPQGAKVFTKEVIAGAPRYGELFTYDGLRDELRPVPVARRPGCALCGQAPGIFEIRESRYIAPSCQA